MFLFSIYLQGGIKIQNRRIGIAIKSKGPSILFKIALMYYPELATVSTNTCSQIHVHIKHFLAYLHYLIPTLAGKSNKQTHQAKLL